MVSRPRQLSTVRTVRLHDIVTKTPCVTVTRNCNRKWCSMSSDYSILQMEPAVISARPFISRENITVTSF